MAGGFGTVADAREGEVDDDVSGISDSGAPLAASTNNQSVKLGSNVNKMTVSNDTHYRERGLREESHEPNSAPITTTNNGRSMRMKGTEEYLVLTIL